VGHLDTVCLTMQLHGTRPVHRYIAPRLQLHTTCLVGGLSEMVRAAIL
jgi:hypothetical protein